ncbi:probable nucleotide sugar dehydratase [Reinekea sp. MED297]|uniref:Probable nucleotide sugar dehydratase n=1 Tax=Reinekea blandensis MED297 TaxID=314283 RepID=A4BEM6_9GAMM|nr:probable nucleotide sugar dehydratase [Reinekea sp. MED297] [Reinekea blandensis MED297]
MTGADGFIGSHLVELLVAKGYQVRALAQYNSFNFWGWLEDLDCLDQVEVVCGDVRDPYFCQTLTKDIDWVFHLAALIAIPYSYTAPDSYVDTNVKGTLNICQAALHNGVEQVIHTSTSEVYGTAQYVPIDEQHPLQPQSPYSASKMSGDHMALSFFNAFGLPVSVARPFNTYGPRQSARAVIPSVITQIASGKKVLKLGDLSPTRDFNYVTDTCHGFLSIAEAKGTEGEIINIGSNSEISIYDTLELIRQIMQADVAIQTDEARLRPEKSEVHRLWCDNRKIKELTGYVPQHDLKAGLTKTIEWFLLAENLRRYKSDLYNV